MPSNHPGGLRRRAEAISDFFADLGYGLRRLLRGRSILARRLVALAVLLAGVAAIVRFVPVPGIPCEIGARQCPAPDHAADLVPGDALLFQHLNTGGGSSQVQAAAHLFGGLPNRELIVQTLLDSSSLPRHVSYRTDLRPWLGDELGYALLPQGREFLLGVGDRRKAEAFLARIGGTNPASSKYGGQDVLTYKKGGLVASFVGNIAVVGSTAVVERAIDVSAGKGPSLAASAAAGRIRDALPDNRFAEVYVSPGGIKRLLAPSRSGAITQLETFVDFGASSGFAVAAVAHTNGVELKLHSALDPKLAKKHPSFFEAFPQFGPSLEGEVGADAIAYLGIGDPQKTISRLLVQAGQAAPGLASGFRRFNKQLSRHGKIDIGRDVLPLLGGEAAIAAEPGPPVPHVTLVVKNVDSKKATDALAKLQAPIAKALNPGRNLQAPTFGEKQIAGATVRTLRLSPTVELSYTIDGGKLIVSTDPSGVQQALAGKQDLAGSRLYKDATGRLPGNLSAVIFLNLDELFGLAEQVGLAEDPGYAAFRDDIRRLSSLGLAVRSDANSLDTTVFLTIQEQK